ncbi:MAG: hypothetical protein PHV30_00265 [Candidatus Margulisbacteria bacterium]|nr:hypothetical protein [Candidatus Margulisiibacteriota bacterium]
MPILISTMNTLSVSIVNNVISLPDNHGGSPALSCGMINRKKKTFGILHKYLGFFSSLYDNIYKGSKKGVDDMRARVNHKNNKKEGFVDKSFWNEFKQRGFKVDEACDGSFHKDIKKARFHKKTTDTYELTYDDNTKFNIVSAKVFMKTVSQIEGLVKYKLFK